MSTRNLSLLQLQALCSLGEGTDPYAGAHTSTAQMQRRGSLQALVPHGLAVEVKWGEYQMTEEGREFYANVKARIASAMRLLQPDGLRFPAPPIPPPPPAPPPPPISGEICFAVGLVAALEPRAFSDQAREAIQAGNRSMAVSILDRANLDFLPSWIGRVVRAARR